MDAPEPSEATEAPAAEAPSEEAEQAKADAEAARHKARQELEAAVAVAAGRERNRTLAAQKALTAAQNVVQEQTRAANELKAHVDQLGVAAGATYMSGISPGGVPLLPAEPTDDLTEPSNQDALEKAKALASVAATENDREAAK